MNIIKLKLCSCGNRPEIKSVGDNKHYFVCCCSKCSKMPVHITKERYFEKPSIITMRIALQNMKEICLLNGITKLAMPKIGCGLDRLQWNVVKQNIESIFADTDIEILVCSL